MKMKKGYFLHPRLWMDWDDMFWNVKRKFSKWEARTDLLLNLPSFKKHERLIGNTPITLQRGEALTSIRFLQTRWGWGKTMVTNFLKLMKELGEIETVRSTPEGDIYSVVNYEVTQRGETSGSPEEGHDEDNGKTPPRLSDDKEKEGILKGQSKKEARDAGKVTKQLVVEAKTTDGTLRVPGDRFSSEEIEVMDKLLNLYLDLHTEIVPSKHDDYKKGLRRFLYQDLPKFEEECGARIKNKIVRDFILNIITWNDVKPGNLGIPSFEIYLQDMKLIENPEKALRLRDHEMDMDYSVLEDIKKLNEKETLLECKMN